MAKKKKRRFLGIGIGLIAAIGLLAFALVGLQALAVSDSGDEVGIDGIEREMEGDVGEMAVAASAVTNSINYQGRLTDSAGEPLSGTYSMTFRLYEVASGGTALDTDTHTVEVTEGLFNTYINIDQSYFDGRALWLGITVKGDSEMTPRQELRPVPYALSLRPGTVINGSVSGSTLKVVNHVYSGNGVYARTYGDDSKGVFAYTTGDYSEGVFALTYGDDSKGVFAYTTGDYSEGVYAEAYGNYSRGVHARTYGDDSYGVYAYTEGNDSDGVHAYSAKGYGVYGKGKYGGYFTTNQGGTWGYPTAGVNVTTAYDYSDGVFARTSGLGSGGVCAVTYGDGSDGVFARTSGDHSDGVGALTTGNYSYGVYAYAAGYLSGGVLASTAGDYSVGVYADTTGDDSEGVYARTTGNDSEGVYARTTGNDSEGVYAYSDKYDAIYASTGRSDHNYGFFTNDNIYVGGKIDVVGTVDPIIVECFNADPALDYEIGDVVCLAEDSSNVKPCTKADDTSAVGVVGPTLELEDGEISVVIMGYRGAKPDEEHVEVLEKQLEKAEARAAEVKLSKLSKLSGSEKAKEKKNMESEITMLRSEIEEAKSITRQVVKVKADASYAQIKRGDLLTTSTTEGHAMKAQPVGVGGVEIHRPGTIIGKAMEPLESGTGLIEVFVTLQ